jgi:mono/diheme cytochrome c family protein
VLLAACHPQDIDPLEQQPKYKAYAPNDFFADGRAMRSPPEGTVPRERTRAELRDSPPAQLTPELLALGREKYQIACAVCHGVAGDGKSMVSQKMGLAPAPSLHDERQRALSAEDIYRAITDGYGLMPRYSTILDERDRWATVAYVRALQLSQHLPAADAPDDVRKQVTP